MISLIVAQAVNKTAEKQNKPRYGPQIGGHPRRGGGEGDVGEGSSVRWRAGARRGVVSTQRCAQTGFAVPRT